MQKLDFGYIDTKANFLRKLENSEIDSNTIVVILDTGEVWIKGIYLKQINVKNNLDENKPGSVLDAVQGRVLNEKIIDFKNIIESEVDLPDKVKQSHVVLTEDEYRSRLELGTLLDDVFYYTLE